MKIGMVCYPTYGGSGIVATELGLELAKRGNEVHFISYALPTRLNQFQENVFFHKVESPNYPLFEFQMYSLTLAGKIIDVIKYEEIDVLHVHYAIPHAISGFLAKEILKESNQIKLITTLHGTDVTLVGLEPAFSPLVKFALEQSDIITAVSKYLADKTKQQFRIEKQIREIPNFVDTSLYKRADYKCCKKQFATNNEKIITHISNFRPVKRVPDVIRIFAKVIETHPAKLLLIGDGPDRSECERIARELQICKHIRFLGQQTSLVELLSLTDIFLLPSQSESFGLSALEAMSCGVPVVATNIGGIPEVVIHGETGYVAELGDISRMAKYVVELIENPKKWNVFSKNARKLAEEKFNIKKIVDEYVSLYE